MAGRNTDASWIEVLIDKRERGSDGKEHWILKTNVKKRVEESRIQFLTIGEENNKPVKAVLLLGQTGSGKSLLMNGFVNHIFNIKYDSPFRLKLRDQIVGEPRDKTQSQTDYVSAFLIYHQEGMLYNDYNLMIIDTPGFDDTRATNIFTNLHDFFISDFGINCLNCIGLVMKANENRSLTHRKELLNNIISLFGKDCSNITRLLCTFAGFGMPVVKVVKNAGITFAGVDGFENFPLCPLLDQNCGGNFMDPCALWENMSKGYRKFFEALPDAALVDVKNTRELLKSRKELYELKNKLGRIADAVSTLDEDGKKHFNEILELKKEFSQHFWDADKIVTRYVGEGWHAHNCLKCGQCCLKCKDPSNYLGFGGNAWAEAGIGITTVALTFFRASPKVKMLAALAAPVTRYLLDQMPHKTKDICPYKCSNVGCHHDEVDHKISFDEMVPNWAIGGDVTLELKTTRQNLKKRIQDKNEAAKKCLEDSAERKTEAEEHLERLISVTENIVKLGSGSDTLTPEKVLEELENDSSGPGYFDFYKSLKGRLSEIKGNGEAEKETSNKRNVKQFEQDYKKFKKE